MEIINNNFLHHRGKTIKLDDICLLTVLVSNYEVRTVDKRVGLRFRLSFPTEETTYGLPHLSKVENINGSSPVGINPSSISHIDLLLTLNFNIIIKTKFGDVLTEIKTIKSEIHYDTVTGFNEDLHNLYKINQDDLTSKYINLIQHKLDNQNTKYVEV